MKSIRRVRHRLPLLLVAAFSSYATFSATLAVLAAQQPVAAAALIA